MGLGGDIQIKDADDAVFSYDFFFSKLQIHSAVLSSAGDSDLFLNGSVSLPHM